MFVVARRNDVWWKLRGSPFGVYWVPVGGLLRLLGASWAILEASRVLLGNLLGSLGGLLGASLRPFEAVSYTHLTLPTTPYV